MALCLIKQWIRLSDMVLSDAEGQLHLYALPFSNSFTVVNFMLLIMRVYTVTRFCNRLPHTPIVMQKCRAVLSPEALFSMTIFCEHTFSHS